MKPRALWNLKYSKTIDKRTSLGTLLTRSVQQECTVTTALFFFQVKQRRLTAKAVFEVNYRLWSHFFCICFFLDLFKIHLKLEYNQYNLDYCQAFAPKRLTQFFAQKRKILIFQKQNLVILFLYRHSYAKSTRNIYLWILGTWDDLTLG